MTIDDSPKRRARTIGVALVALAVITAACGSDEKSATTEAGAATTAGAVTTAPIGASTATTGAAGPSTAAASTTAAGAPTTAAGANPLGTPNAAKGDPILIGTINEAGSGAIDTQSTNTLAGMTLASKYANDYLGGIAGHPIEIVSCGNKATPAGATDCANQMVEKKISAYIMPYSAQEVVILKILQSAGIPSLLMSGNSTEALTGPITFAMTGGYPATLGAFAMYAKAQGLKKVAHVVIDVPAATGAANSLGDLVFGNAGVDYQVIPGAPGTPDLAPQLQSAVSGGADAVMVTGDAVFCASFLQAYKSLGLKVAKFVIATCVDKSVIEAVPDVLDGSAVTTYRAPGPEDAIYGAAAKKYDTSIDPDPRISAAQADGWVTMMGLVNALKGYTGPIDAQSVAATIKAAKDADVPLSNGGKFTCDGTAIPSLPNICSGAIQVGKVDDKGNISGLTGFDVSKVFAGKLP